MNILLIENERTSFGMLRVILQPMSVTSLSTGEAALELIDGGERFDAILCDLHLDSMSGGIFVEELRSRSPNQAARVILIGNLHDRSVYRDAPAALLTRPFGKAELHAAIERVAIAAEEAAEAAVTRRFPRTAA